MDPKDVGFVELLSQRLLFEPLALQSLSHKREKLLTLGVHLAAGFDQSNEWIPPSRRIEMSRLSICKPAESSEVPPVRRAAVAAEFLCQSACGGCTQILAELLGMLQPGLIVARRGFYNDSRTEACFFHGSNIGQRQIVDKAQVMLALGPNIDVPAERFWCRNHPAEAIIVFVSQVRGIIGDSVAAASILYSPISNSKDPIARTCSSMAPRVFLPPLDSDHTPAE